ncbi:unnamed protein product [Cuscuta campestris]|uniref:protein disulfide-isomerase n=1 Tax=Cuscuta campestris TaxID=132261 RepID=A0A484LN53_9ASTE|nr:unnamed protein product [Cuscuta campestris]
MEKFIAEASIPIATIFDENKENHAYVNKFFDSPNDNAILFVNFSSELGAFKPKFNDVAVLYKGKGIGFLLADLASSAGALQYYGLKEDQRRGKVDPFIRSEAIPEVNDERVKVVVRDSLDSMVLKSGKNVLLEFYAPWCGHCKKLAPILDEVAVFFESHPDVLIAKLDATANDVPTQKFEVQGYLTLYFISSTGDIIPYEGDRTKDDIIDFIQKNKGSNKPVESEDSVKSDSKESAKDEL